MHPVFGVSLQGQPEFAPQVIANRAFDMNGLAEHPCFTQPAQLERWRLEPRPVIYCKFSPSIDYGFDDSFSIAMVKCDGLFEENMTACRDSLPRKGKMRLWRRGDVQDIGLFHIQHFGNITVPSRDGVTNGQLLSHYRFQIADSTQLNRGNLPDLFDMRVSDFSASNNRYLQAHCLFLPNET
jgi:hypothetical protein